MLEDASLQGLLVFLTRWALFPQAAEGAPAGRNSGVLPGGYQPAGLMMGSPLGRTPFQGCLWRVEGLDPTPRLRKDGGAGEKQGW